jgi:hypothetical protein
MLQRNKSNHSVHLQHQSAGAASTLQTHPLQLLMQEHTQITADSSLCVSHSIQQQSRQLQLEWMLRWRAQMRRLLLTQNHIMMSHRLM